jgi:peptidoglycan/xylan/chitin deacetylase (PgdA/CDA1 family)
MPILDAAGYKSTQYIISGYFNVAGYVAASDVLTMEANGHEIGAHTRSHPDLTTLSASDLAAEVAGSRQDLLDLGVTAVNSFAYPYGAFNSTVVQAVQSAGFTSAVDSIPGPNLTTDNHFTLRRYSNQNTTTIDQVKAEIDDAVANDTYLILLFHQVDYSGETYSITPDLFQQIVSYLQSSNVSVVTASTALGMMQP